MKASLKYFSLLSQSVAAASMLMLAACGEPHFKIKGEIYGADNESVLLEKSDFNGRWVVVDSTRTSSSGSFAISRPAPAAPEIFRLSLGDKFIYLPVDSIETVTVETSAQDFGHKYTLSGSDNAVAMQEFEQEVMALPQGVSPDSLASFKRNVFSKYLRDAQGSVVSYYVLTKTIGNTPLFDPQDDYKYFAAVATGFKHARPNDPRAALLEQTTLNALKQRNSQMGKRLEIAAEEIKMIDIDLPDEKGKNQRLSDIAGKGKPTVVMFTVLTHPDSPALNAELSKLYNAKGGAVNFYQVSLDPDQYAWRDAARNLPWTTVYDPDGEYSKAAQSYNVGTIPTFFIYNTAGELSDRAESIEELRKKI